MERFSPTNSYTWVFAFMGIVSILFGLLALVWPGLTLGALLILFAAYAVVGGVLSLVHAFSAMGQHRVWWPFLLIGVVNLIAAVFIVTNPGITATTLVFLVAFWWIFSGMMEIFASFVTARFLWLLAGVLAIVAGFVLLGNPQQGALALVMVIGIYAIIRGVVLLVEAFRRPEIAGLKVY